MVIDGACSGNPGPGGWACLLRFGGHQREFTGFEHETTNNRMEHEVAWTWVPGHQGNPDQERCDLLAKLLARKSRPA